MRYAVKPFSEKNWQMGVFPFSLRAEPQRGRGRRDSHSKCSHPLRTISLFAIILCFHGHKPHGLAELGFEGVLPWVVVLIKVDALYVPSKPFTPQGDTESCVIWHCARDRVYGKSVFQPFLSISLTKYRKVTQLLLEFLSEGIALYRYTFSAFRGGGKLRSLLLWYHLGLSSAFLFFSRKN